MANLTQNIKENITDRLSRGIITVSEANVEMIRAERFRIVKNKIPREVRKALNEAVKNGLLAHSKKTDINPEAYYHPSFDYMLRAEFKRLKEKKLKALADTCRHLGTSE